jgi:formaldehyde-activating enzyme involved in methanogenesis
LPWLSREKRLLRVGLRRSFPDSLDEYAFAAALALAQQGKTSLLRVGLRRSFPDSLDEYVFAAALALAQQGKTPASRRTAPLISRFS